MSETVQDGRGSAGAALGGPRYRWWVHAVAVVMVLCTFSLLTVGGIVTTLGEGLAVYDGWTSFGYYVPLAPLEYWVHDTGKLVEHGHRLIGKVVGVVAIVLAGVLWFTHPRKLANGAANPRRWLAWLGLLLLLAVIVQGAKGAFRIDFASFATAADGTLLLDEVGDPIRVDNGWSIGLALVHGVFGQVVFAGTVLVAAAVGPGWVRWAGERVKAGKLESRKAENGERGGGRFTSGGGLRWAAGGLLLVLVLQLVLGATVRHLGAWNAIPDFPLTWGYVLPPVDQGVLDRGGALGSDFANGTTVGKVHTQYVHRVGAVVVTAVAVWLMVAVWRRGRSSKSGDGLRGLMWVLGGLLVVQWVLGIGAAMIGRGEPAWGSAHQVGGALLLALATLIAARAWRARGVVVEAGKKAMSGARGGAGVGGMAGVSGASGVAKAGGV